MEIVTHRVVANGVDQPEVEIPEGVTHIGENAFYRLPALQHVKLPSSLEGIDDGAFLGCYNLLSVDFSKCRDLKYIGENAFAECLALRHVSLSNCVNLVRLKNYAFDECVHLALHIPRTVRNFGEKVCGRVQLVAMNRLEQYTGETSEYDVLKTAKYLLLPKSIESELEVLLATDDTVFINQSPFWVDDYDRYADVFDAMGELNVIWIESLRRQGKIRSTGWTKAFIVQEAEIRNRVIDLWRRVRPFDIINGNKFLFEAASDTFIADGSRLVAMRSYQNQPEETKIFKEILAYFDIREPARPRSPTPVGRSKRPRRLMANLRL